MGMLDALIGQLAGNTDVAGLAARVGLTPAQVEMAVAALARAHPAPGDTVATAANETGLHPDALGQIVAQLGGEGALGSLGSMLGQGGAGGMLGSLGGLFGKS
ncbi:hypothetical protein [Sphingomonas sp.]|uniref:hypothetical protein n=1 Tax=Sphingomonas sp. TaxID=28214 RepID=UPI0035BBA9C1